MKTDLKKIDVKLIAKTDFDKVQISNLPNVVSVNHYEEAIIKHDDFMTNYTFEFLKDSAVQFGQGIWMVLKGFAGMSMWSIVSILEGLKFLWKAAFGKKGD